MIELLLEVGLSGIVSIVVFGIIYLIIKGWKYDAIYSSNNFYCVAFNSYFWKKIIFDKYKIITIFQLLAFFIV